MTTRFNPLDYPACFLHPSWVVPSRCNEHIPFVFALIELLRPRTVVELDVFEGASYAACCQAIAHLGLPSRAFGVEIKADELSRPVALDAFRAHHDARYSQFSRLIPQADGNALAHFADGSIDLLKTGSHRTVEAARREFADWLPKMSERGVMLFPNIDESDKEQGAAMLWRELNASYRTFEFPHQQGLGVLFAGRHCPDALAGLLDSGDRETASIRAFYFQLGQKITQGLRLQESERRMTECRRRCAEAEQWRGIYSLQVGERDELLHYRLAEIHALRSEIDQLTNSAAFRYADFLSRNLKKAAPAGSVRRKMVQLVVRCILFCRPQTFLAPFRNAMLQESAARSQK
jgi:hypothetical protein